MANYPSPRDLAGQLDGFDALALDVGSDRKAALDLLKSVIESKPQVAVIALARNNDPETILQCLRAGAAEFLSSPFPPNDLRQAVQRIARRQTVESKPSASRRGRLIVFSPVKGGAGSTTLATNVAYAIKRESGSRVLLADMNLAAGIVAFLLRLQTPYSVLDALRHSSQLDDALWKSLVVSYEGVDVLAAPERPEPALIEPFPAEEMFEFCRSMYDYVIADLGGVCEGLGLTAANAADSINLVCSTDMPSLFMMRRTIPLLEEMGRSREQINVLVNRLEKRSDLSTEDMEKIFRASVHASFPEDAGAVLRAQRKAPWRRIRATSARACAASCGRSSASSPKRPPAPSELCASSGAAPERIRTLPSKPPVSLPISGSGKPHDHHRARIASACRPQSARCTSAFADEPASGSQVHAPPQAARQDQPRCAWRRSRPRRCATEVRGALCRSSSTQEQTLLSAVERNQIVGEVLDEVFGLGPLEPSAAGARPSPTSSSMVTARSMSNVTASSSSPSITFKDDRSPDADHRQDRQPGRPARRRVLSQWLTLACRTARASTRSFRRWPWTVRCCRSAASAPTSSCRPTLVEKRSP